MAPRINTAERITPMIYCYSIPGIEQYKGWVKIGFTEKQDVDTRIKQQTHTVGLTPKKNWQGTAVYDDGSFDSFRDTDFHAYLQKLDVERKPGTEWFHISPAQARQYFSDFKANRGQIENSATAARYELRDEQKEAVRQTVAYHTDHPKTGEMLWNAKPRFGKTLTTYDFAKQIGAKNVLILTNRPAIAASWYGDYEKFLGTESGYAFVSETPSIAKKPLVRTRHNFLHDRAADPDLKMIEFVSLQDLKGSIYGGGRFDKLGEIYSEHWDLIVLDEAHEGVDTLKTAVSLEQIPHDFTLHLSGTPFKALANDKFPEKAIYNWTYADEQKAKRDWNKDGHNPYADMPQLNLYTYQMSEIIKDEISKGINLDGEQEEYAFDLNEFFAVRNGRFIHDEDVNKFLDALTRQEKYPFSTEELRDELKHTFWLLPRRVEIAKAMAAKLKQHPIFKDYEIVLAAGNGKLEEDENSQAANENSLAKVKKAIAEHDRTITLSVGQLTTGVTVPQWSAVLMLSNMKSPSEYIQAAFRAQNPYTYREDGQFFRKERAYVFDFDPVRTLDIYNQYANDLSIDTSAGKGGEDERKNHVRNLLNFFPVLGEDEDGKMVELSAEKVLSIPQKLRAVEVVNRGFMSDFLFQNITRVFNAPKSVIEAIKKLPSVEQADFNAEDIPDDLYINDEGDVDIPQEILDQREGDLFGASIYEFEKTAEDIYDEIKEKPAVKTDDPILDKMKEAFVTSIVEPAIKLGEDRYGNDFTPASKRRVKSIMSRKTEETFDKTLASRQIQEKRLEKDRQKFIEAAKSEEEKQKINTDFDKRKQKLDEDYQQELKEKIKDLAHEVTGTVTKAAETDVREKESQSIQDTIKKHLRGFTRTIPSFLMAYGDSDNPPRLDNFDTIIPADVFEEVTSIPVEMFRTLRDGGYVTNEETGEKEYFEGEIFDAPVFNKSVLEFMIKKDKLADYFSEKATGDIFDYIPPQQTNQIFTPKKIVKQMVDELEEQDPGCFDNPRKTFIDLYMKSGLYPAEIIKRLFRSSRMKKLFPDEEARLKHIIENQVYGLAPSEIIYRIATNYILGSSKTGGIKDHKFRQCDTLPLVKEGKLEEKLDELYPERA